MKRILLAASALIGVGVVLWVGDHLWYDCSDLFKACVEIAK